MLHLAQSEMPVLLEQLDRHRFLLNCQNGIVDVETCELRPHDPDLMLTKICPFDFNPSAPCPRFLDFLGEIMEDNGSLIDFHQLWFGYCLTADVREHAVAFFHGGGNNGKTTLLDTIVHVMGDYATVAAPGLLMMKRNEQHPTEIADLLGKWLVVMVETQEGRRFNESIFKWLSGGDRLKARFMKQDFFEFAATHKFSPSRRTTNRWWPTRPSHSGGGSSSSHSTCRSPRNGATRDSSSSSRRKRWGS